VKLSPDTLARLRAAAETMGISVDELAERCILDSLPTIEHEDLIFIDEAQVFTEEKFAIARNTGKAAAP
jgi:hypothetical protein